MSQRRWEGFGKGISLMIACWVSQSLFHQSSFKWSDGVSRKMFNGEIIFHLKRYWKVCFITSERLDKNYCKTFLFASCPKPSLWRKQIQNYSGGKQLCGNYFKERNRKFMFPWTVINWHVLQIAKTHFRHTICLMISEKCLTRCMFLCVVQA